MRDTIEMAREASVVPYIVGPTNTEYLERIERLIELARADEREACALICTNIANKPSNVILGVAIDCAAAIRARGETK
jgi:hypothetical protein